MRNKNNKEQVMALHSMADIPGDCIFWMTDTPYLLDIMIHIRHCGFAKYGQFSQK
jgi:hypothetical protein